MNKTPIISLIFSRYVIHMSYFIFRYQNREELKVYPYWGILTWYEGGGYQARLGSSVTESNAIIGKLMEMNWVDQLTRALILRINLYNANSNLFSMVSVAFEFPPSGGAFVRSLVDSVTLYRYNAAQGIIALIAEIGCVIVFVIMVGRMGLRVIEQRGSFISYLTNWANMFIIISYCVALVCYVYRSIWTIRTLEEVMNDPGKVYISWDNSTE